MHRINARRAKKKVALKTRVKIWHFFSTCLKRFQCFFSTSCFSSFPVIFYDEEVSHYKLLISTNMDGKWVKPNFCCLLPSIRFREEMCMYVCLCLFLLPCYWFCEACARSKHLTTAHQQEERKKIRERESKKSIKKLTVMVA